MRDARLFTPVASRLRPGRVWQVTRAAWRNARVIWSKFYVPITVFMIAVFGGGWVYDLLAEQRGAAYDKPYWDRPYQMATLMIFASPDDLPEEPELVAFWYLMPMVGAFIAARGVTDFVNLFFSPTANRNAWEVALASTYRDHIIVLGVGHLGTRVVRALVEMGFPVVAIDHTSDQEKMDMLNHLKVPLIPADGRLESTLMNAGIRKATALIVCTSNDHMNIGVTMRARDLNPDIRIVVRMWEDQFADLIKRRMNVEYVLSATDLAAPSFAAAALGVEITRTMEIGGVEYSLIRLEVERGSFMDGKTVGALQADENLDIVLHAHDDTPEVHPDGSITVRAGDTLVLFAQHNKITQVVARNRGSRYGRLSTGTFFRADS